MSQCSHDPRQTSPRQGAYRCPQCGQMVMAGVVHLEDDQFPYAPIDRMDYDQLRPDHF